GTTPTSGWPGRVPWRGSSRRTYAPSVARTTTTNRSGPGWCSPDPRRVGVAGWVGRTDVRALRGRCTSEPAVTVRDPTAASGRLTRWNSWTDGESPDGR